MLSSNALIQCIANILSPIPWAPIFFVCGAGAAPARRAYPCLSSFTRLRGLKIRRACAHAETNCIARLEAGIEICLRQSKLPLRSIAIRLRRSKLHPALLGATKRNNIYPFKSETGRGHTLAPPGRFSLSMVCFLLVSLKSYSAQVQEIFFSTVGAMAAPTGQPLTAASSTARSDALTACGTVMWNFNAEMPLLPSS